MFRQGKNGEIKRSGKANKTTREGDELGENVTALSSVCFVKVPFQILGLGMNLGDKKRMDLPEIVFLAKLRGVLLGLNCSTFPEC